MPPSDILPVAPVGGLDTTTNNHHERILRDPQQQHPTGQIIKAITTPGSPRAKSAQPKLLQQRQQQQHRVCGRFRLSIVFVSLLLTLINLRQVLESALVVSKVLAVDFSLASSEPEQPTHQRWNGAVAANVNGVDPDAPPILPQQAVSPLLISTTGSSSSSQQQQSPPPHPISRKRPSIVLFGDSLTQRGFGEDGTVGWASLLASAYTRRADVKNRGFGGYNTRHALQVWPNMQEAFDGSPQSQTPVLFATVFFGANDAALPGNKQHVSLEEYKVNIEAIISKMRSALLVQQPPSQATIATPTTQSPVIFLFTPPPVDEEAFANFRNYKSPDTKPGSNRSNLVTRQYGNAVKEIVAAQQEGNDDGITVALVDTWELLEGSDPRALSEYLSDGLHLNDLGNRKVYQGFMELIRREYPGLAPKTDTHEDGIPFEEKAWHEWD